MFINWATGIDKKTGRPIENPDKRAHQGAHISGIEGWYGLPVAANLPPTDLYGALGAVGIAYESGLNKVTTLGATLYVFALD